MDRKELGPATKRLTWVVNEMLVEEHHLVSDMKLHVIWVRERPDLFEIDGFANPIVRQSEDLKPGDEKDAVLLDVSRRQIREAFKGYWDSPMSPKEFKPTVKQYQQ